MAVLLGGRAAEHVVFAEISTGAADDLQKVANIARSMVTRFGMAESSARSPTSPIRASSCRCPAARWSRTARVQRRDRARDRRCGERDSSIARSRRRPGSSRDRRAVLERGAQLLLAKETLTEDDLGALRPDARPPKPRALRCRSRGSLATRLAGSRCEGGTPGSHSPDKGESPPRRQFSVQR